MKLKPIVLKIGGSAITDKSKPFSLRRDVLIGIARDVAKYVETTNGGLVIIHGGGSFGHPLAFKHKRRGTLHTVGAFMEVGEAMKKLNSIVVEELRRVGVDAYGFQTSSHFILKNGEVYSYWLDPIVDALDLGVVPVLYGDIVVDLSEKFNVLSGDTIASILLRELNCERGCFATSVDGVYGEDSRVIPLLELRRSSPHEPVHFRKAEEVDVTGGMGRKLSELTRYCRPGTEIVIFNGRIPGNTYRALSGIPIPNSTTIRVTG